MRSVGQTQHTHQTQNRQGNSRIASATARAEAGAGALLSCVAIGATVRTFSSAFTARRYRFQISNTFKFKFFTCYGGCDGFGGFLRCFAPVLVLNY